MSQGVKITIVMNLKPEVTEQFCAGLAESLKDTRKFDGCRWVNVYRNGDDPNKIVILEEWDSRPQYEKYLAWRNESGGMAAMADLMTSPPALDFWPTLIA